MELFLDLNRQGITVVMVTHEPDIAAVRRAQPGVPRRPAVLGQARPAAARPEGGTCGARRTGRRSCTTTAPRHRTQEKSHEPADGISDRAARPEAQPHALHAHRAGHHHRRRGGDRDGLHRPGRARLGAGADRQPGQQPDHDLPRKPHRRRRAHGHGRLPALTEDDAHAIQMECPSVLRVSGVVRTGAQVVAGDQNWGTQVQGVWSTYPEIREWPMSAGAFFTESDVRGGRKVCVLGQTVAREPVRQRGPAWARSIRIKKMPFRVVGVLSSKGTDPRGNDQDDIIMAPLPVVQRRMQGITNVNNIMVSASDRPAHRPGHRPDHGAAAPASPHPGRRGRRLHRPQPGRDRHDRQPPPRS